MNLMLLKEASLGKVVRAADEFVDMFDNSTLDSIELCTKGIVMLSKEVAKAEAAEPKSESIKQYKVALNHAKRLRAEAKKIPPDKWTDHALRLMKTNIFSIGKYVKAVLYDKSVKTMTRESTISSIDLMIKGIEARIDVLEKSEK